jgi:Na+/melibiose symporter-like transporter
MIELDRINNLIGVLSYAGTSLCVIGVAITIFLGLGGRDQSLGIIMAVIGVCIFMIVLLLLILKLCYKKEDAKEVADE